MANVSIVCAKLPRRPGRTAWTPDGESLIIASGGAFYEVSAATGKVLKRLAPAYDVSLGRLFWSLSPDGRKIAYVGRRPEPAGCEHTGCEVFALYLQPVASSQLKRSLTTPAYRAGRPTDAASSTQAAAVSTCERSLVGRRQRSSSATSASTLRRRRPGSHVRRGSVKRRPPHRERVLLHLCGRCRGLRVRLPIYLAVVAAVPGRWTHRRRRRTAIAASPLLLTAIIGLAFAAGPGPFRDGAREARDPEGPQTLGTRLNKPKQRPTDRGRATLHFPA
jgi:hypothetical protein